MDPFDDDRGVCVFACDEEEMELMRAKLALLKIIL